jgi:hypothetical protein
VNVDVGVKVEVRVSVGEDVLVACEADIIDAPDQISNITVKIINTAIGGAICLVIRNSLRH